MNKQRLGRGLQALIPEIEETALSDVMEIDPADIRENPYQPRKSFAEDKLAELAQSVKLHGILQPLIVRPGGSGYELVAGERRLRAAKKAGLAKVPVIVKPLTDREVVEIALIENLQREDLNPMEEAQAYRRLMEEFNYTQEELAKSLGKSRSAVANTMRLLTLHADVRPEVMEGRLSEGHARAILPLPLEKQPAAAKKIIELGLSVREAERLAGKGKNSRRSGGKKDAAWRKDQYVDDLEERLRQLCSTEVNVRISGKGRGKLEIHFYDIDELERICELLF